MSKPAETPQEIEARLRREFAEMASLASQCESVPSASERRKLRKRIVEITTKLRDDYADVEQS